MRYQKVLACAVLALGFAADRACADLLGVDVSTHQGTVNWNTMKNDGVSFAFTKATEGVDFIDARFTQNMNGARNAGVLIGPYHYGRPDSGVGSISDPVKQDAINEANDFVDAIEPYYLNYPGQYLRPVLDVEELPFASATTANQRTYLSAWIKDFNSVVKNRLGTDVIIYLNGNYAQNYITADIASYDLWFAKPNGLSSPPTDANMGVWSDWVFWQYSWTGNLGGENPLDLNTFRGTLNDLQQYVVGGDFEPPLVGDYNSDGVVDAADYTVWRDTWTRFNTTDLRADGNKNGAIDTGDRDLWAANIGARSNAAVATPEPAALALLGSVGLIALLKQRGR